MAPERAARASPGHCAERRHLLELIAPLALVRAEWRRVGVRTAQPLRLDGGGELEHAMVELALPLTVVAQPQLERNLPRRRAISHATWTQTSTTRR